MLKHLKALIVIFSIFILISSCSKELDINIPNTQPKIVLNTELFQDSTFNVYIYRSSVITEEHNNLLYIDTAIVNIYSDNTFIETLSLNKLGNYKGKYRIKPNTNYHIKVEVNGLPTTTSSIQTLDKIPILSLDSIGQSVDSKTEKSIINFSVRFKDNTNEKNYYMIDFSEHTIGREQNTIYSKDPAITVEYGSYYFSDELFNGDEYTFTFCVPEEDIYNGFTVHLCHITKEYYRYMQTIEADGESDGLSIFFQAVQIYSNVENGYGIVGAISSSTQKYEYHYPENDTDNGNMFDANKK